MLVFAIFWKRLLKIIGLSLLLIVIAGWIALQSLVTFRKSDADAIKAFQEQGIELRTSTLDIQGHDLHFATTGVDSLPTIVFVHGSPGGWIEFEDYLKDADLRSHFRLISVDRPGFGYSEYGTGVELFEQGSRLITFLKKIDNGQPLYLLGHSLGGPVVALLAAEAPELVNGIVVIAGSLDPEMEPTERWRKTLKASPWKYLLNGAFRASNEELFYFKKDVLELKPRLSKVTCPVVIFHATDDMLVDVRNVDFMQRNFVNAKSMEVKVFPEGNHFVHKNHYDAVKERLLDFAKPLGAE